MHLGPELSWPSDAALVFRGGAAAEHFCLGGDPSQANLASGAFLDGLPAYSSLLKRLQQARKVLFGLHVRSRRYGPLCESTGGARGEYGAIAPWHREYTTGRAHSRQRSQHVPLLCGRPRKS